MGLHAIGAAHDEFKDGAHQFSCYSKLPHEVALPVQLF